MKMNKKGFTLIEMLVVIAIIAILVAIILPTVTSATTKATAAANAANLRSFKAELSLDLLDDNAINGSNGTIKAPAIKKCGALSADCKAAYSVTDNVITVGAENSKYGIDYFAKIAETGKDTGATQLGTALGASADVTAPAAGG